MPSPTAAAGRHSPALAPPASAWAPYTPTDDCPWTLARAAHLYRRAGFGASWAELQAAVKAGPERTIETLLQGGKGAATFEREYEDYEKAVAASSDAPALRAWWLRRMIRTPHPLREKMTLFWHDFFAVSAAGIPSTRAVLAHMQFLRNGAMGSYGDLLAGVVRDPAALLALGAKDSRKAAPNPALARQVLHRYTVGPDHCTPRDVQEAARAMTGWRVLRLQLRCFAREHDDGTKTVLGKTGRFARDDVVRIAAAHPATARRVVRRLYRWLISEIDTPSEALIEPLAKAFAKDLNVGRVVATMLRSRLFYSDAVMRRRVKRPVEFAVGLVRAMEAGVPTAKLAVDLAAMGENLYYPPTPAGWAGGTHWLTGATMIARANLAADLLASKGKYEGKIDPAAVARRAGHGAPAAAARFLNELLLQAKPAEAAAPSDLRTYAQALACQAEYQLA